MERLRRFVLRSSCAFVALGLMTLGAVGHGAPRPKLERTAAHLQDLERRVGERLEELSHRVTAQLDDLSRRQQQHADRVTQLLDQVMAQLGQRVETLVGETRARLDELQQRTAEIERRKLSVADFGATLATLGQRFTEGGKGSTDAG